MAELAAIFYGGPINGQLHDVSALVPKMVYHDGQRWEYRPTGELTGDRLHVYRCVEEEDETNPSFWKRIKQWLN